LLILVLALGIQGRSHAVEVSFSQSRYGVLPNVVLPLDVEISYDPGDPTDLFSYGVRMLPEAGTPFTVHAITVPAELDFFGAAGAPALIDLDPAVIGVKGTVDVEAVPQVNYGGAGIATFNLSFQTEGTYDLDLDFFRTLGPTEDVFFAGDRTLLDPGMRFVGTTVTVPEPATAYLVLMGLACCLLRVKRRR
jgi:hypothetical protein